MTEPPCGCISFCEVKAGMRCRILCGSDYAGATQRLADLGLVPGVEFDVVREAPFGDPVEISVNGCHMALRRNDGASIVVQDMAEQ